MKRQDKLHARKLLVDWLQTLTIEDRKCIASMIGELDRFDVRNAIESGPFAWVEQAEKSAKTRAEEEKAERHRTEGQRTAREFRAGPEAYVPNAPSEVRIYPKLAPPPQCLYPNRTNCNHDLVNPRCEFMKFVTENTGDFVADSKAGQWVCTANEK